MNEAPKDEANSALPRDLRFLKVLVTVLTVVMIGGVITITALLVIRLNSGDTPKVVIDPGAYALPADVGAVGISVLNGQVVIVGDDRIVRVYDTESRELVQEIELPR